MDVRSALYAVIEKHGTLTPPLLLDEARDKAHPLHERFEWDDAIAGEEYRLIQAREVIQCVRITHKEDPRVAKGKDIRAFFAVPQPDKTYAYEPLDKVLQDDTTRKLVLLEMERDYKALERRYEEFQEFWEMVSISAAKRSMAAVTT